MWMGLVLILIILAGVLGLKLTSAGGEGGTQEARIRFAARRSASSRARRVPITQVSQGCLEMR